MIFTPNTHELLALHYVYPLPVNKLQRLLYPTNQLEQLEWASPNDLASNLGITISKAWKILQGYRDVLQRPLQEAYQTENIYPLPYTHPAYPKSLFELIDPPSVLYVKGNSNLLLNTNRVAVIGARKATAYSATAMTLILPPLIEQNYIIVSGLARGADTLAHEATISFGGQTIGVLGHGFHHLYPKENKALAEKMAREHLLITEFPPYAKPEKWHFPMRNRIISGLSQALVVTEAALRSGTLITTEHALDHGKDVFVVPGPITSEQSMGTNRLLQEGAMPVWNGHQIVESLKLFSR